MSAYKWDMEKIIITCNAEYLSYEFPKRKWYQVFQSDRIVLMRLDYAGEDDLRADILLRILEHTQETFSYDVHYMYRNELYETILQNYRPMHEMMEHVVLLDMGDALCCSMVAETDEGAAVIRIMNKAGYGAMVPGAQDFAYGITTLKKLRSEAAFPFLAANIRDAGGKCLFEEYRILTINHVKIGIVGVTDGLDEKTAERELVKLNEISSVKHVIAVVSGKGGVGKSFVTSLMAAQMQRMGCAGRAAYLVAHADDDIYSARTFAAEDYALDIRGPRVAQNRLLPAVESGDDHQQYDEHIQNDHKPCCAHGP